MSEQSTPNVRATYFSKVPSLKSVDNYKEFFILYDSLRHVSRSLAFSLYTRYVCRAGCKHCYLDSMWIPEEQFGRYVPASIPDVVEEQILQFFENFHFVESVDDLLYMKQKHPHLYDFYKRNGKYLTNSSTTDTAFIQQYPILMNDIQFREIYEVSFSDTFLDRKNGTFAQDIVTRIKDLHARTKVNKIKMILTREDCASQRRDLNLLRQLADDNNIAFSIHPNITSSAPTSASSIEGVDVEQNYVTDEDVDDFAMAMTEIVYMQYTGIYMTLVDSVKADKQPIYDIIDQHANADVSSFMAATVRAKLNKYRGYLKRSSGDYLPDHLQKYMKWVVDHVSVPTSFNFIPGIYLPRFVEISKTLERQSWSTTQYGLYKSDGAQVSPIIHISDKPSNLISQIPVRVS